MPYNKKERLLNICEEYVQNLIILHIHVSIFLINFGLYSFEIGTFILTFPVYEKFHISLKIIFQLEVKKNSFYCLCILD